MFERSTQARTRAAINIVSIIEEMISSAGKFSQPRRAPKMLYKILKTSIICTIVAQLILGPPLISAASNQSPQTNQTGSVTSTNSPTSHSDTKTSTNSQQPATLLESQQPQSTDMSSVYVQIPIAEQSDTGVPIGVQQTLISTGQESSDGQSDNSKQSSWTGPWPKKFQIGYIKQSDLHQVLIESLKNDPFVGSLGSPDTSGHVGGKQVIQTSTPTPLLSSTKSLPGTKSVATSDSSSLMSSAGGIQAPKIGSTGHWPSASSVYGHQLVGREVQRPNMKNVYQHQQSYMNDAKLNLQHSFNQHQMQRFHQHQQQLLNSFNRARPFNTHHQQHKLSPMTNYQQPQVQFANFPSNMLRNQPVYTINNFQNQELDGNQALKQSARVQQYPAGRANGQQSNDYYGSWRPVTSDKPSGLGQPVGGKTSSTAVQIQTDSQGLTDDFEDGFSTPSKDEDSSSNGSTNRHPMLNRHIGNPNIVQTNTDSNTAPSSKLSPAMLAKTKQSQDGTKTAAPVAGTKSSGASKTSSADAGAKGGQSLTSSRRRASNNAPTSSSSKTTSTTSTSTTDVPPTSTSVPDTNTTTNSPLTSNATTTVQSVVSTTTNLDAETTEPDVEVIETETTESSATEASTTPSSASSTMAAATETTSGSSTQSSESTTATNQSVTSADSGESEVATQTSASVAAGSQQQQVKSSGGFPSVTEATSTANDSSSPTTREETTPSSAASSSSPTVSKQGGEVEGANSRKSASTSKTSDSAPSDEALLAEVVQTGSDIGKARSLMAAPTAGSNSSSSNRKQTRSSDRLRTSAAAASKKTQSRGKSASVAGTSSNKLQRQDRLAKQSNPRSAKQVNDLGVKGGSVKSLTGGATKSPAAKGANLLLSKRERLAKSSKLASGSQKSPRMVQQSEKLQQSPQVVSMTAAQAQSTAQTLASLLLARCLSSANCAHLLDICSTKQAAVPYGTTDLAALTTNQTTNGAIAAWSMPIGLQSSSLMSLAQTLQADRALKLFPQWREAIENVVDQDPQTGYTIILPSNEAIERLPMATIDLWLANGDLLSQVIDNHLLDSPETIDIGLSSASRAPQTRMVRSKGLQINQHRDRMVTINGRRLVYANQPAPSGGRIHVIDGILDWPAPVSGSQPASAGRLLDIMDTLKQCDKFDGFVTLAEGTGLTQILKQDGPMTVFVPSNEALRKIPDDELELIKNNSTALKEFLMYHVVNGSYFSQDLRDGQQLASILDMKPIQVGVRVDGCSRRLVEANTSPMRRADIVAKNGVIHILDWYLTTRDNEWCGEPTLKRGNSETASVETTTSQTSDRLQQVASEQVFGYATRVSLPSNQRATTNIGGSQQHHLHSQVKSGLGQLAPASVLGHSVASPDTVIVSTSLLADNEAQHEQSAVIAHRDV